MLLAAVLVGVCWCLLQLHPLISTHEPKTRPPGKNITTQPGLAGRFEPSLGVAGTGTVKAPVTAPVTAPTLPAGGGAK